MAKAMYDPWSKIVTKNGYAGDEVISALQSSPQFQLRASGRHPV